MALTKRSVSVDSSWFHNPIVGKCLPFILGIGAIFRRWIQSSKDGFLSRRSLDSRVTTLTNLGAIANLSHLREYEAQGGLREPFLVGELQGGDLTEH